MTEEEKIEFVRKIQNNTQEKPVGIKSMIAKQKKLIKDLKLKKEKEKFENKLPNEISIVGIIHTNRKKMSSKKCLEKHLRYKKHERKEAKRIIIKAKDVK